MEVVVIRNLLLQSCSYLVKYKSKNILIDCGDSCEKYIRENNIQLECILLTHCHQDHICGLHELLNSQPKVKIYCSQLTFLGLQDEDMNLSYIIPEYSCIFDYGENILILKEGKQYIEGVEMHILATPGHSDDCLAFIIGKNIFTGDSYIPFAKVFSKWPRSNSFLAKQNEKKLIQLVEENKFIIYPGHWR